MKFQRTLNAADVFRAIHASPSIDASKLKGAQTPFGFVSSIRRKGSTETPCMLSARKPGGSHAYARAMRPQHTV